MMPKQWKLIALYMLCAYVAFAVCIEVARRQVIADEQAGQSLATRQTP